MHNVPAPKIHPQQGNPDTPIVRANRSATKSARKKLRREAFRDPSLTPVDKAVLAYLGTCRPGHRGWAPVWFRAITKAVGRGDATIYASLARLRDRGYLERKPSYRTRTEDGSVRSVGPCAYRLPRKPRSDRPPTDRRCSPITGEGGRSAPPPDPQSVTESNHPSHSVTSSERITHLRSLIRRDRVFLDGDRARRRPPANPSPV